MVGFLNGRTWRGAAGFLLAVGLWLGTGARAVLAGTEGSSAAVADGAGITPEVARSLFDRLNALHEADGCRLVRFDTSRFRITIGLEAPSGAQHAFDLSTAPAGAGARSAGGWSLGVTAAVERDCGPTVAAIAGILGITEAPQDIVPTKTMEGIYRLLSASFVVLVFGTLLVLVREARLLRPSRSALLALAVISVGALALRLFVSPRTFLHEYYHIAETVPAYLTGTMASLYGKTGPALFRLVGALVGEPDNVQVIFLTNAVLASLAIPALALLDLALMRSWPRALCGAVLLAVLPLHLRFSAAEDLFIQAVTFGLWSLGLFALYLRTGRLADALLTGVALALTMQVRPEMLIFPGVLVAMVLLVQPRSWRLLFAWPTLVAAVMLAALLIPRFIELRQALGESSANVAIPDVGRYLNHLVLLHSDVTPPIYWLVLLVGLVWSVRRGLGLLVWTLLVFGSYTVAALTLFDNPPYNLRSQLLPTSMLMLVGAGAGPVWIALWGSHRRQALICGAGALAAFAGFVVLTSRGFVTELRDQQLEWSFLERAVPQLPPRGTLLTTIEVGGFNLNAFPQFLLRGPQERFEMIDVRRVVKGEAEWPAPGDDVIFYQGMFCYFALEEHATLDPMTDVCQAVHARYVLEPMLEATLDTQGYSHLHYARGPYRIGFFRLKAWR